MKTKFALKKIMLLIVGGIAITLAGINWTIGIAAWIAPVFLLKYTRQVPWREMIYFFLVLAVAGMISQTGNNLLHLPAVNVFNGISFGLLTGLMYVVDKLFYQKESKLYYTLIFPSATVLIEFAMSFAIGTWGSIAHTQFAFKPLMQFSSIAGSFGISFMVAWGASVVNWIPESRENRRNIYRGALIYTGIFSLILLFGLVRLKSIEPGEEAVKVAAVTSETNIHHTVQQEEEALTALAKDYTMEIPDQLFSDSTAIQTLIKRTENAVEMGAKIITWNEIALILNRVQKQKLLSKIKWLSSQSKVYVLLAFLEENSTSDQKPFNNISVMISPDGEILWEYKKSFLHPYAEAPVINNGPATIPVISTPYGKIGNVICADLDMPDYIKQAGKQNVDIMLVPAFDWAGITPLHSEMASLEAIQNGFSIVRANGSGETAVYNFRGDKLASLSTYNSDDKMLIAEVPVKSVPTIYSLLGNILVILVTVFMGVIIFKRIFSKKNEKVLYRSNSANC